MLSSYDTDEVRANFRDYIIVPIQSASGMRSAKSAIQANGVGRTINREILVLNYDPPAAGGLPPKSLWNAPQDRSKCLRSGQNTERTN